MEPSLANMSTWAGTEKELMAICVGVCVCVFTCKKKKTHKKTCRTRAVLFLHNHYSLPPALIHFYSSNFMVLHLYILCVVLIDQFTRCKSKQLNTVNECLLVVSQWNRRFYTNGRNILVTLPTFNEKGAHQLLRSHAIA